MKQAISIQLIFILEIKLQKEHFSEKHHIFQLDMRPFCSPIRMEMCLRMPQYKN